MDITEKVLAQRAAIVRIAARRNATNVRLIGSVARGDSGPESDVDLVVRFLPGATAHDPALLADELELLLGRKVDVISEVDLRESTRARLADEAVSL